MRLSLSWFVMCAVTVACSSGDAKTAGSSAGVSAAPAEAAPSAPATGHAAAAPAAAPEAAAAAAAAPEAAGATAELTSVQPSLVCMINDQFMGREQIPVVIEGRTYYGCCPACKQKLEASVEARSAVDPVTGRAVDKAKAVIGRKADGNVLYFESAETMARYGKS